jgi:hypothetical protein
MIFIYLIVLMTILTNESIYLIYCIYCLIYQIMIEVFRMTNNMNDYFVIRFEFCLYITQLIKI